MKKFTIFFLTIRILHVSIAQKPPLKMQLDQVENTANAVLILQTSVLDYQQQERGAVIHSDFNQIMQNRETMKKFDFTFSLIFAPVIGNNHALTYTATYNAENKTINFYELERGMYIDPNMHIYTPSRYLERYSSGFGIYTGNKKVKSVEDKFMLLLQKNKNDTISLSSLKANFIEKEQLAAQNILWKQEAKRQLEIRMQKERVTQAQAIANLQEGDKICAKHTSCDRLNQDDCLIVSAFIEKWNSNRTRYQIRIYSVNSNGATYSDASGVYAEIEGVRYHRGEIIWIDPLEKPNTIWFVCH